MEITRKLINKIIIVFSGLFAAFSAAIYALGDRVIDKFCGATAQPFLGTNWSGSPYCDLVVGLGHAFIIAFIISLVLILGSILLDILKSLPNWVRTPSRKNLHLFSGSRHGDIYTLKFISTEWRYPFRENDVYINVAASSFGYNLTWTKENVAKPITIQRWKLYEVNFLEVHEDSFRIITEGHQQPLWDVGRYVFTIQVMSHIFAKQRIVTDHVLSVAIDYKGKNRISVKITERNKNAFKLKW